MTKIVKTEKIDGKKIEIHENSYGQRRYWAKVDGAALFQRGRMHVRTFTTSNAAWQAALDAASRTAN